MRGGRLEQANFCRKDFFFVTRLKMNDPKDCHYTFLQHSVCLNSSKSQINFKPCIGIGGGGR